MTCHDCIYGFNRCSKHWTIADREEAYALVKESLSKVRTENHKVKLTVWLELIAEDIAELKRKAA